MSNTTENKFRIPFYQKGAFGAGQFVLNLLPGVLGVYLQVFILTAFGMDPFWAGLLGGLPRVFDALTDPVMGFVSDNTKSRWGRRRPYIFSGAIISGVLFILMWQLDENASQTYNFWYVMILQILFLVGNTMFATPLVGLGYEMTPDYNERTRLMGFANTMGQIAWMIVPWLYVIIPDPQTFDNPAQGVRTMAILVGAVCIVFGVLPAFFCKGTVEQNDDENYKELSFSSLVENLKELWKSIVQVSKNKPFMKLCGATFLVFNGFQLVAAFSVFIIVFYMNYGSWEQAGTWPAWFNTLNAIITAFIVIPIISKMATKWGKRNAFLISTVISIVGYLLKWWGFDIELNERFNQTRFAQTLNKGVGAIFDFLNPILEDFGMTWFQIDVAEGIPWLIFGPIPLFAFGMGGLFTLMMSMTADVCDLDELENGGPRKEGTFGAIYWWMVKLGQAIAIILSGLVLKLVGFDQNITNQAAETMQNLRIADICIPALTAAGAFFVMLKYDLNESKTKEIQKELARLKAPKPSGYSTYDIFNGQSIAGLSSMELMQRFPHHYKIPIDFEWIQKQELESEFISQFKNGMHGLCFSVYGKNQFPGDRITEAQIRRRLEVLKPHTKWVRVFSCTKGHEMIPEIAKEMGFKTMVGAWISDDFDDNNKEIQSLLNLIDKGFVDKAVVGNEVLFRAELEEDQVINYIEKVRTHSKGVPVCYVDVYYQYIQRPKLVEAVDEVLINCYPFWEGADINYAGTYLQEMYEQTKNIAKGKKVVITETGWPSAGQQVKEAIPSSENYMKYFLTTQLWANNRNVELFYFSSFDEAWKIHAEGWAGTSWGLWTIDGKFKFDSSFDYKGDNEN